MITIFAKRACVLYHFYEANQNYVKNFQHFLTFATNIEADFYCVIAGNCSFDLPTINNVNYIFTENKNWDYGGYAIALKEHITVDSYEYFAFINSSVRGPFIPPVIHQPWIDSFISLFSDHVGGVGSAIDILPSESAESHYFQARYSHYPTPLSHIQTTAYVLSHKAIKVLLANRFYEISENLSKEEIICRYEILLSQILLKNGLNIKCLLPEYNKIDYRQAHNNINPTSYNGDPTTPDGYFGRTIHPYESIFIKTQRGLYPDHYLDMLTKSMLSYNEGIKNLTDLTDDRGLLRAKYIYDSREQLKKILKKLRKSLKRYLRS
jgi:hypothetical protein